MIASFGRFRLIASLLWILLCLPACAGIIQVTGVIDSSSFATINPGTTFVAYLPYDASLAALPYSGPPPAPTSYAFFPMPGHITVTFGDGESFTTTSEEIDIDTVGRSIDFMGFVSPLNLFVDFRFRTSNPGIADTIAALPDPFPSLSEWDQQAGFSDVVGGPGPSASGTITSLDTVPEPRSSACILFGGLAMLCAVWYRSGSRSYAAKR